MGTTPQWVITSLEDCNLKTVCLFLNLISRHLWATFWYWVTFLSVFSGNICMFFIKDAVKLSKLMPFSIRETDHNKLFYYYSYWKSPWIPTDLRTGSRFITDEQMSQTTKYMLSTSSAKLCLAMLLTLPYKQHSLSGYCTELSVEMKLWVSISVAPWPSAISLNRLIWYTCTIWLNVANYWKETNIQQFFSIGYHIYEFLADV